MRKSRKMLSAAAAVLAASAVATSASARYLPVDNATGINIMEFKDMEDNEEGDSGGNYVVDLFISEDAVWAGASIDRDIDLSKIGGVAFTFQIPEGSRGKFYGTFGGQVGGSFVSTDRIDNGEDERGADYNWMSKGF